MEALAGMAREGRAARETVMMPLAAIPTDNVSAIRARLGEMSPEVWSNLCEKRYLGDKTPQQIGDYLQNNHVRLQEVRHCFQSMTLAWDARL